MMYAVVHDGSDLRHQCAIDILRNTLVSCGWVYYETPDAILFHRGRHPSVTAKWNWVMTEGVLSECGLAIIPCGGEYGG